MGSKLTIREGSILPKARALSGDLVDENGNTITFSQVGSTSGLYFDTPDATVTIKRVGDY